MKEQSPVRSSVSHHRPSHGGSRLLPGMLLGFCCSSAVFLALTVISESLRVPPIIFEETMTGGKFVHTGVTIVPVGNFRPAKKLYTDRIKPVLAVISQENRALATPKRAISPTGDNDGCKPGRSRNAKGQCVRWPAPSRTKILMLKHESSR